MSNDPTVGLYGTAQLKATNIDTSSLIKKLAGASADPILSFTEPFNFVSITVGLSGALQSSSSVAVEFDAVPNFAPTSNTPAPISKVRGTPDEVVPLAR